MTTQPLMISAWPQAILHLDADAFFASVEQAMNPSLKGKPVITGAERGIVAAASYEAKAMGVKRGVPLSEAKKICPGLICLPSDYETYSIFSKRIFAIMRRFTPTVEEYSIDEAFADLKGVRRVHHASYEDIAQRMKETVDRELGITVSVGLSLSKSLAKLASKLEKPSGLTIVSGRQIHELLAITPLKTVWGFGANTTALLEKHGLKTALDFVCKPESFAKAILGKVGVEIHQELSGSPVHPVSTAQKATYFSISKMKTFTPPSRGRAFVYAQALRNLEGACLKARRYHLSARKVLLILKHQDFSTNALELKIMRPSSITLDLVRPFNELFGKLYNTEALYRATGVVLGDLLMTSETQYSLFEDSSKIIQRERVTSAMDAVNMQMGKHKVHLAESLAAQKRHEGARGELPQRKKELLKGETFRQRIGIPVGAL